MRTLFIYCVDLLQNMSFGKKVNLTTQPSWLPYHSFCSLSTVLTSLYRAFPERVIITGLAKKFLTYVELKDSLLVYKWPSLNPNLSSYPRTHSSKIQFNIISHLLPIPHIDSSIEDFLLLPSNISPGGPL